jgi:SAM-dependent methyltransferase
MPPQFDRLSGSYEDLLKDPIRDLFSGDDSLFFHVRKRELIRRFFARRGVETRKLQYLDVGCGKGELLRLLSTDFGQVAGCDVSQGMMETLVQEAPEIEARRQESPLRIPYADGAFDFVTAVCVYHHVPLRDRDALTNEIRRVLKPGGVFCMIEHNPLNPATQVIVKRTPIDADAILLRLGESRQRMVAAGLVPIERRYFLYFPRSLYRYLHRLENALGNIPLGGQYAMFAERDPLVTQ